MKIKIAVVGGRDFSDYELLENEVENFIYENGMSYSDVKIISGGAAGADALARRFANERNISLVEYFPNWSRFGKSAGFVRNKTIVDNCTILIAFWDGQSKGTLHSISLAREQEKLYKIVSY